MPDEVDDSNLFLFKPTRIDGSPLLGQNRGTIGPYHLLERVGEGGMGEVGVLGYCGDRTHLPVIQLRRAA